MTMRVWVIYSCHDFLSVLMHFVFVHYARNTILYSGICYSFFDAFDIPLVCTSRGLMVGLDLM